jgi:phosphosulfolactate phosphohydrolase-like enzyme
VSAVSSAIVKKASVGKFEGISILCAGRQGKPSEEDNFCAGLMVDGITRGLKASGIVPGLGDTASTVAKDALSNRGHSLGVLRSSEHGQYLESLGFEDDLVFASRIDLYDVVPIFDGNRVILLR